MFDENSNTPKPSELQFPEVPGLEFIAVIARGGHGTVYEARQEDHDRLVAVKVLDARWIDETARRRFERERVALGRISDHPAIVSLFDSGYTASGEPYLVLEHAAGGSLDAHLDNGPMNLDTATTLVICLAAATERIHNSGIVHRDIKPANVLRSAYGDWMLTDFGIASLADVAATGAIHATYAHTAPETFTGESASPVSDVYSLASVLATCLTGNEPFAMNDAEAPVSVMRRVASEPYPDLRGAGVPNELGELLEMALSKEPRHRPVSARAFAGALNEFRVAHGLMAVAVRTGNEIDAHSTVLVDDSTMQDVPTASWAAGSSQATGEVPAEKSLGVKVLTSIAALALLFGLGFSAAPLIAGGVDDSATQLAAAVEQVFADDGPGNGGDGPGNNGNGRGNGGNGPGNGGDGNGRGNGGNGPGNGGPGNGRGNGGNGQGNGGPGNGGN